MSRAGEPSLLLGEVLVGAGLPRLDHPVTTTSVVLGAVAHRDWAPVHHDPGAAQAAGVDGVFFDTPTQQAWLERALVEWAGPSARLGRMSLRMLRPIVAGSTMEITGRVVAAEVDTVGCGWVTVELEISTRSTPDGPVQLASRATARVALPRALDDDPWARRGDAWQP